MNLLSKDNKLEIFFCLSFSVWMLIGYLRSHGWLGYNIFYSIIQMVFLLWGLKSFFQTNRMNKISKIMTAFIAYILLSGISYFYNDRPASCYTDALLHFVMPMLAFYCGVSTKNKDGFILIIGSSATIMLVLCLFSYFTLSPRYLNFINEARLEKASGLDEYTLNHLRFSAISGSAYFVMYLCAPLLAYYLCNLFINGKRTIIYIVTTAVLVISLIFCQQRTAILFVGLAFIYYLLFSNFKNKIPYILFIVTIFVGLYYLGTKGGRFSVIMELVLDRASSMTFSEAFGEREDQVFEVFKYWNNIIIGDGVGVYSHEAFYNGFTSVRDNGWIKILVENGIIGIAFFVIIISMSLKHALLRDKHKIAEVLIIIFYMIAMIGSNSLSMLFFYSIFFWYAIGGIWNENNVINLINNKK